MPHTKEAFDWLEQNFAEVTRMSGGGCANALYVGVRHDMRPWWHDFLCKGLGVSTVTVLEIHGPNVEWMNSREGQSRFPLVKRVVQGDVREVLSVFSNEKFDLVFWDHGPEHVTLDELGHTTPQLQSVCSRLLLYCCPWGEWPQGAESGNENECHRSSLVPDDMIRVGMSGVVTVNGKGIHERGELIATWTKG